MKLPPRYIDLQLEEILHSETQPPKNISERDFLTDIKSNKKIKWKVNPFLFKKKLLPHLVDEATFKRWKVFRIRSWLFLTIAIGFIIWTKDYKMLLFFVVYLLLTRPLEHWIFIFNITVLITFKLLFRVAVPYFWALVTFILIGYVLNKIANEMIEKKILKQALSDLTSFWKYYSHKIIWMEKSALNGEYRKLTEKYPDLLL